MSDFIIKQADFKTSVVSGDKYPEKTSLEIAMAGKSNVGKSSLINSLCQNYKLARTSATPGKTRHINFFTINREFYLVDLPGYGFAKAPKSQIQQWSELMETYLSSGRLDHIFLLLDIRHPPTQEDKQMFDWIIYYGVPYTLIATKADKIAKSKRKTAAVSVAKQLGALPYAIAYSTETSDGKAELLERIGQIYSDVKNRQNTILTDE